MKKVNEAKLQFRKFFLLLLANEDRRKSYLRDELHQEYGTNFHNALKQHVTKFVDKIDANFPVPVIDQVYIYYFIH